MNGAWHVRFLGQDRAVPAVTEAEHGQPTQAYNTKSNIFCDSQTFSNSNLPQHQGEKNAQNF
jgi:hypothetical protein